MGSPISSDKRQAIINLKKAHPDWSARRIAKDIGTTHATVISVLRPEADTINGVVQYNEKEGRMVVIQKIDRKIEDHLGKIEKDLDEARQASRHLLGITSEHKDEKGNILPEFMADLAFYNKQFMASIDQRINLVKALKTLKDEAPSGPQQQVNILQVTEGAAPILIRLLHKYLTAEKLKEFMKEFEEMVQQ